MLKIPKIIRTIKINNKEDGYYKAIINKNENVLIDEDTFIKNFYLLKINRKPASEYKGWLGACPCQLWENAIDEGYFPAMACPKGFKLNVITKKYYLKNLIKEEVFESIKEAEAYTEEYFNFY